MLTSGTRPPSGMKLSCMALTAPQEAAVVTTAKSAESAGPKRTSLPSMLPPSIAERVDERVACGLGPVGDADAGEEEDAHGGEDRPALALVADHAAEDVGERGAEGEDRHHLQEVRERGRVLERMRGVGVEEAAAVGAEHLDRDLGGDRADGDGLARAFERGRLDRGRRASAARRGRPGRGRGPPRAAAARRA